MFSNKARLIVAFIFLLLLIVAIYLRVYAVAAISVMFIGFLGVGYFKEGPIILAAKYYHKKDYQKAEELLDQIKKPAWLSKKRRGFYEFLMGGICLQKREYEAAESHYEVAALYPLRSANDHVAALVHVANLSIRHSNFEKAKAYLELAVKHEQEINARMKAVIERLRSELKDK
jgi:tetratricopeptide (TPR) repeat protein